ncbi:hypothetical protein KTT_19790 [Tengunoibacter tsumagoiensis]|uniref:Uncharacterized protein n=2 Tax=Tengunoibacter tsumagoiensis TaxID=2014871 RepID=A0A401ZZ44_9CHLR|nr:hypothetical protein KTT_19790 [Tengunoibacter tsumagoiensis]
MRVCLWFSGCDPSLGSGADIRIEVEAVWPSEAVQQVMEHYHLVSVEAALIQTLVSDEHLWLCAPVIGQDGLLYRL